MTSQLHNLLTLYSFITFVRVNHITLFFLQLNLELLSLAMILDLYGSHTYYAVCEHQKCHKMGFIFDHDFLQKAPS